MHNPHFYQLSQETRERVMNERASRGLSTASASGVPFAEGAQGGGGLRGGAEECPLVDPLCVEFYSAEFHALIEGEQNEIRSDIRNAHRMVSHYEHNSLVDVNARLDEFQRVGREKMVRKERIVYLRGGRCAAPEEQLRWSRGPLYPTTTTKNRK